MKRRYLSEEEKMAIVLSGGCLMTSLPVGGQVP